MPVPAQTLTSHIIQNIRLAIKKYNSENESYDRDYKPFMIKRKEQLNNVSKYAELLRKEDFCRSLLKILRQFGMDARASKLTDFQKFQTTICSVGHLFDLLNYGNVNMETLNLKRNIENQTVYSIIKKIFNSFAKPNELSTSGGFVIASKTMHMIMPEIFMMIDIEHIGTSLYRISDYKPHPIDGLNWEDAVPQYCGNKPNPSPRGAGRELWNSEKYSIALLYGKRLILEWCNANNSNIKGFIEIDAKNTSSPSRIIDKALW